ncbi:MAG: hypothetical protein JRJ80_15460 [Deltaproteobacteria bacterium]|jgi:hypothetical protein|nr:hypothetical protein [Deltaproteobacteria bacterium]MBW1905980.1 hypothetical protein [Deltaproteobacteria bacterium]MBW2162069.1 hypothetical protein [Deltaproteobacteria bacterium]
MKTKSKTNGIDSESAETSWRRNPLLGLAYALAVASRQRNHGRESFERDDALTIVRGIACAFQLLRKGTGDKLGEIEVLYQLSDIGMALYDLHPGLYSQVMGIADHRRDEVNDDDDDDGYEGSPF